MKLNNEIVKDKNGEDIHIVFSMGGFDKDILCAYAHRLVHKSFFGYKWTKLVNIYDERDNRIFSTSGSFIIFSKQDFDRIINRVVFDVDRVSKSKEAIAFRIASINKFRR